MSRPARAKAEHDERPRAGKRAAETTRRSSSTKVGRGHDEPARAGKRATESPRRTTKTKAKTGREHDEPTRTRVTKTKAGRERDERVTEDTSSPDEPTSSRKAPPGGPARVRVANVVSDDQGAKVVAQQVAKALREFRKARHYSLDDLAAKSGVSRAALSQIEGARTNPTLAVLWKIAVGLDVPFQELLGGGTRSESKVRRAGDAPILKSADGKVLSRLLSVHGGQHRGEIYELTLKPRAILRSDAHAPGTEETVLVSQGLLRVTVGDEQHDLGVGDSIHFHADLPHSYQNVTGDEALCLDFITYARFG